jgi:homoprotocatechuate degradation regulator HpaR
MVAFMSDPRSALRQTARSLPIALLRARETVMGPFRDMLARSGVNEQKWRVLRVLEEQGPLELGQLAVGASLMLSSLARMMRPMEKAGLVTRMTPPEDRRKSVVAIAPAGLKLVHRHADESRAILLGIERDFGSDQLDQLLTLLETLQKLELRGPRQDGP